MSIMYAVLHGDDIVSQWYPIPLTGDKPQPWQAALRKLSCLSKDRCTGRCSGQPR